MVKDLSSILQEAMKKAGRPFRKEGERRKKKRDEAIRRMQEEMNDAEK